MDKATDKYIAKAMDKYIAKAMAEYMDKLALSHTFTISFYTLPPRWGWHEEGLL